MTSVPLLQEDLKHGILKRHYENEAKILGLTGHMSTIHSCLYEMDLNLIPIEYKKTYCKIIGVEYENDSMLMNQKMKNGEILKLYSYIDSVLFDQNQKENDSLMFFFEQPSIEQVKQRGIEYYYVKAGSATVELLMSKYSKFELLFMAAFLFLFQKEDFVSNENFSKEGLASLICSLVVDLPLDPRMIITMFGPRIIHNNVDLNLNSDNDAYYAAHAVGLNTSGLTLFTMYKWYCMSQVNPSIFLELDNFRPIEEQIEDRKLLYSGSRFSYQDVKYNTKNEMDMAIEKNIPTGNFEEYVYYGMGDGLSQYTAIKRSMLPEVLKNKSHSLVRKAIYLLDKTNPTISRQLFGLLDKKRDVNIKGNHEIKLFLVQMFNIGMQFMDSENELLSYSPSDIYLRFGVEPIPPTWTDKMRANISEMLEHIQFVPEELRLAPIVTLENTTVQLENLKEKSVKKYKLLENEQMFEMECFVENLTKLLNHGLFDALFGFGVELISTANYYHMQLYGNSLVTNEIEIDNVI